MRVIHSFIYRLTTTRAVLIVFGGVAAFLAYSTYHSYTSGELPMRNLCVICLVVIAVVGLGSAAVAPNPVTRSAVGFMVFIHSAIRAYAFALRAEERTSTLSDFLGEANAMYVHVLLAYTGLLVWARSRHEIVR